MKKKLNAYDSVNVVHGVYLSVYNKICDRVENPRLREHVEESVWDSVQNPIIDSHANIKSELLNDSLS